VVVGSNPSQLRMYNYYNYSKYRKYANALLKKSSKSSTIKPISGFKISIKGRLNGIKRTRKVTTTYKGVSPNTICSAIKQHQLPIYTK
jgi:hypothetical protein|tara:strand:- start:2464 stop:2727 length:264 start_codon:yes stop_codon:yes gene_type:complete